MSCLPQVKVCRCADRATIILSNVQYNALSDEVIGDVVVLANADMAFDDSMSLQKYLYTSPTTLSRVSVMIMVRRRILRNILGTMVMVPFCDGGLVRKGNVLSTPCQVEAIA
jgi:hypothetical protein